jgi:hypothetical protein
MYCETYEEAKCLEQKVQEEVDLTDCISYFDGCNTCMVSGGVIE